ncbi:MAG: hypothetical protein WDW38_003820 [Sanguina aurantia]
MLGGAGDDGTGYRPLEPLGSRGDSGQECRTRSQERSKEGPAFNNPHPGVKASDSCSPALTHSKLEEEEAEARIYSGNSMSGAKASHRNRSCRNMAVLDEMGRTLYMALPRSSVEALAYIASLLSASLVGSLGTVQLSGLMMGSMFFNVTGLSITIGLSCGMESICGQLFGAGHYGAVGVLLQRATGVCLALGLPSYVLMWFAGPIMLAMGLPPDTVALAADYVWMVAPCLALSAVQACCKNYFAAQGIVFPLLLLKGIATMLYLIYTYLLIRTFEFGFQGAALAYLAEEVTEVLLCVGLLLLYNWSLPDERRTWRGFSWEAWKGWGAFLAVALPSTALMVTDWWVLELMILLAGLTSDAQAQVVAMGLALDAFTFVNYFIYGIGSAAATRVSNELGAAVPGAARLATNVALGLGLTACCLLCGVLAALQPWWTALFTTDPAVLAAVTLQPCSSLAQLTHNQNSNFTQQASLSVFSLCVSSQAVLAAAVLAAVTRTMPWVFLSLLGYCTNAVLAGVLSGAGRQSLGVAINLATLWLMGVPLAAFLALVCKLEITGLWVGMVVMFMMQGGILLWQVLNFDWAAEVARVQESLLLHMPLTGGDGPRPPVPKHAANGDGSSSDGDVESRSDMRAPLLLPHGGGRGPVSIGGAGSEDARPGVGRRVSMGSTAVRALTAPLMVPLFRRSFGGEVGGGMFGSLGNAVGTGRAAGWLCDRDGQHKGLASAGVRV